MNIIVLVCHRGHAFLPFGQSLLDRCFETGSTLYKLHPTGLLRALFALRRSWMLMMDWDCKRWLHRECIKMNKTEYKIDQDSCRITH